jgi:hypothetical protein
MQGSIWIEDRLEAYGAFFRDDFAIKALEASKRSERLDRIAFDLVCAWRSASYSGALPAVLVMTLKKFHDGYTNEPRSAGMLKYSEVVLSQLCLAVPTLTLDEKLGRAIQSSILDISCRIVEVDKSLKLDLDLEAAWKDYLKIVPFQLGVHALMRQTYLAIFSAYEDYIISLLKLASGEPNIRITDRDFNKKFRGAFGDLVESVWYDSRIQKAKLVRHALMHAGGRVTKDLECHDIPVKVHEGYLHIFPEHNQALYDLLKVPALAILKSGSINE